MTSEKLQQINDLNNKIKHLRSIFANIGKTNVPGGGQFILATMYSGEWLLSNDYRYIDEVDEDLKIIILNYYDEKLKKLEKEFESL